MRVASNNIIKRIHLNNNVIWIMVVLFFAVITGNAIADTKWIYFGVVLIPFLVYLCIEEPFIFPFGLYVFLLPLDKLFVLSGAGSAPALTKFIALLIIPVLLVKGLLEKKFMQPVFAAKLFILLLIWSLLTCLWAINPESALNMVRNVLGFIVFYLIVSSYKIQRREFEILKMCIIGGGLFAGLLSLYKYQLLLVSSDIVTDRASVTIGTHETGLNSFAFALLLPVSICLGKIVGQKKKLKKIMLIIVLFIILFPILLTGSRGGYLGAGTIFIIYILSIKQKISYSIILSILLIFLISLVPTLISARWEDAVATGGSGRLGIWYVGLIALGKYWLTGAGLGNFPTTYNEFIIYAPHFIGYRKAPHNIFVGIFVELGIVGITLTILAMWKHYQLIQSRFNNKYNNDSIMLKAAFGGLLVSSCFLDTFLDKQLWTLWMMIIMYSNVLKSEKWI